MNEWDTRLLTIFNRAVHKAQEENRRNGVPNVYVVNGTIVWQLPDGSITTVDPLCQPVGESRETAEVTEARRNWVPTRKRRDSEVPKAW